MKISKEKELEEKHSLKLSKQKEELPPLALSEPNQKGLSSSVYRKQKNKLKNRVKRFDFFRRSNFSLSLNLSFGNIINVNLSKTVKPPTIPNKNKAPGQIVLE
ncbi:hypothetical protein [Chengkuizengella sediminis]|uniref:hypothetical protein n=1 Tax=Chengkuizengella sediminis TaxID=1885917 RepID=UPI001389D023|nr:hypothetical protein [Chengkuizengella sediminis]NDI37219.1 hypothetical protein [Chengkuizengella sediminis]